MNYLTINIEHVEGRLVVKTRLSDRHPDAPCQCEDPDFEGEDIHERIDTTMIVDFLRLGGLDICGAEQWKSEYQKEEVL